MIKFRNSKELVLSSLVNFFLFLLQVKVFFNLQAKVFLILQAKVFSILLQAKVLMFLLVLMVSELQHFL